MIPLHVHSNFTLLKGTITVEQLVKGAARLGLQALALTDTNAMNGVIQFAKIAKENKIKPIIGTLIDEPGNKCNYFLLLAKNNKGYTDVCKIITSRNLNDDFSIHSILKNEWRNLFIITPSIELLKDVNPSKNIFIELITSKKEKKENRRRFDFATANNFKCVATNPIYFLNKRDFQLHKTVTAIRMKSTLKNIEKDELVDEDFYFKDPALINTEWKTQQDALDQSNKIANECNVDLKLNDYKFPSYHVPAGDTAESLLWKETYKGLSKKYHPITDAVKKRVEDELAVVKEMNFTEYFLIVWDIVREAKKRGMMIIGRGSAANSIVAYCLGLTQVDPIELNLYFERFMNKSRSSPPDVDLDFSWKERDEIIKYIFEEYGYEKVAMISTTVTFRARSAFREVAKAYGLTNEEISKFSRRIPWTNAANLPNLAKLFPESKKLNFNQEPWKSIVSLASKIAGFPRHLSIHPGGIVIAPNKITDYVALE
ncbi:MAG: DNA polymerase III subunit alpha, partial [Ignavibacteriaceae bacterium]|nr:DNA polymerase III subunit alpha [Ignavibacteriaceae bacterium]